MRCPHCFRFVPNGKLFCPHCKKFVGNRQRIIANKFNGQFFKLSKAIVAWGWVLLLLSLANIIVAALALSLEDSNWLFVSQSIISFVIVIAQSSWVTLLLVAYFAINKTTFVPKIKTIKTIYLTVALYVLITAVICFVLQIVQSTLASEGVPADQLYGYSIALIVLNGIFVILKPIAMFVTNRTVKNGKKIFGKGKIQ